MLYVTYGALGVLVVLGLLALGLFIGWRGHVLWLEHTTRAVRQELSEQEKQAFEAQKQAAEAQRKAFDGLMGYNADVAYGLNIGPEELFHERGDS